MGKVDKEREGGKGNGEMTKVLKKQFLRNKENIVHQM